MNTPAPTRTCLRCGVKYWDDGNSMCPECDSATAHNANLDPQRVLLYRLKVQAKLELLAKSGAE